MPWVCGNLQKTNKQTSCGDPTWLRGTLALQIIMRLGEVMKHSCHLPLGRPWNHNHIVLSSPRFLDMSRLKIERVSLGATLGLDKAVLWSLVILVWVSRLGASLLRSVVLLTLYLSLLVLDFRQDSIPRCRNWPCKCIFIFFKASSSLFCWHSKQKKYLYRLSEPIWQAEACLSLLSKSKSAH